MYKGNAYEVKVNSKTFDILSANTAFYGFIGSRLYNTFDKLVEPSCAKMLPEYIEQEQTVILPLVTEAGDSKKTLALFVSRENEEIADIKMIVLDEMQEWEWNLKNQVTRKNAILRLYNDYYFEYDAIQNHIRVYAADRFEANIMAMSLEDFEKKLLERADESNMSDVKKLVGILRSGGDRFAINIAGDILNIRETAYTLVKGMSIYENGEYVYTTGYIHFWSERSASSAENKPALERDYLTGVLTKAEITKLVVSTIDEKKTQNVTLAIIDIDYFKKVNDVYGHMKGDEVLKKVASIIRHEVRDTGLVGRFGGDEFLVLFFDAYDMETMRERLRSIRTRVAANTVKTDTGEEISLTLSIGCAAYPKDADNYEDLFFLADFALYRAKEKGRNRYIIYGKDKHGTLEDIRNTRMGENPLNSRGNMSPAELVCAMQDKVYTGKDYPLFRLLDDISLNMNIQRVMLYAGTPFKQVGMAGANRLSKSVVESTIDYLDMPELKKGYDDTGVLMYDNIKRIANTSTELYDKLKKQQIISFAHIRFKDKYGTEAVLSLEFVKNIMTWNESHIPYYRLLTKILSEYDLGNVTQ
ncbi:MAG: GGDEF domain-containing protein [Lachnospiraceae bacterium]|nr:GGDEF domain-containing protein [Lachnospiraceae bacterium]